MKAMNALMELTFVLIGYIWFSNKFMNCSLCVCNSCSQHIQ